MENERDEKYLVEFLNSRKKINEAVFYARARYIVEGIGLLAKGGFLLFISAICSVPEGPFWLYTIKIFSDGLEAAHFKELAIVALSVIFSVSLLATAIAGLYEI